MRTNITRLSALAFAAGLAACSCGKAETRINPLFTPVELVKQSDVVLTIRLRKTLGKTSRLTARVVSALKGTFAEKAIGIDLAPASEKDAKEVARIMAYNPGDTGIFFAGSYREDGPKSAARAAAFLHYDGAWLRLAKTETGWNLAEVDSGLRATWAGATDMLIRCVQYVLAETDAAVPAGAGVSWGKPQLLAKLEGKVHSARAVDVGGKGQLVLFIAAEKGDRLFEYDPAAGTLKDVSAARKIATKSIQSAWGDFNADGRIDYATWDGVSLRPCIQGADGTFSAADPIQPDAIKDCLSLSPIYTGESRTGLVVATSKGPILLQQPGRWGRKPDAPWFIPTLFVTKDDAIKRLGELGAPGPCMVADFDLDGIPDILQLFATGAVFCKSFTMYGTIQYIKDVVFLPIDMGRGHGALFGDYDADGQLDIVTVGDGRPRLWQNIGVGKFIESLGQSGDIAESARPGAIDGMTGDVNNDGRQDLVLFYADKAPQVFFNRGFRSLSCAASLDVASKDLLPQAAQGQQTGSLADLNGDGAQDLVLVLKNGEVWFVPRAIGEKPALCVRIAVPTESRFAGPHPICAYIGSRCLGAWNVSIGGAEAFFGIPSPGTACVIEWRETKFVPKKEVRVEKEPVRVVLKPGVSGL